MSRIKRTPGNSPLDKPPRLVPRLAPLVLTLLSLLVLAILLQAWMGSVEQRDESSADGTTSTMGVPQAYGIAEPKEFPVPKRHPRAAPGREGLDSIIPHALSLKVVVENNGVQELFLGDGAVMYRAIGGEPQLRTAPVRQGVLSLPPDAPSPDAPSALPRGILFERLETEDGWSAFPDVPYLDLHDGGDRTTVLFVRGTAWMVRVVDGETGHGIRELAVRKVRDGGWGRGERLTPPSNAVEVTRPIVHGTVELDPVLDQHSTFWFGAPGFSWFPYGVQRRGLLGHLVELQTASSIEVACSEALGCTLRARLLSTVTATYGERLGEWSGEPGNDLIVPLVPPGTYILSLLGLCPGGRTIIHDQEIAIEAGVTRRVSLPCEEKLGDLTVVIAGEAKFLDGPEPTIEPFLPLGGGGFDRKRLERRPQERLLQPGRLTLRYHSLPLGSYVLRLGDLVWTVAVESAGDNVLELQLDYGQWRDVLFVDEDSGSPLEVRHAAWCLMLDDVDHPTGSILPSTNRISDSHVLTLDLPPGELRLFLAGSFGTFYTSVTVRAEESVYAVPIPTPHVLYVTASDGFPSHIHSGYWLSFRFRDEQQEHYPATEIGYVVRPTNKGGRIVSFTFRRGAPTEVFVPPIPARDMVRGQWLTLPWGGSKRLNLGVDGERFKVGR